MVISVTVPATTRSLMSTQRETRSQGRLTLSTRRSPLTSRAAPSPFPRSNNLAKCSSLRFRSRSQGCPEDEAVVSERNGGRINARIFDKRFAPQSVPLPFRAISSSCVFPLCSVRCQTSKKASGFVLCGARTHRETDITTIQLFRHLYSSQRRAHLPSLHSRVTMPLR